MPRKVTSFRLSDLTTRQLAELVSATGENQSEVMARSIDRMFHQEIRPMKTYIVVNERFSNEPVPATLNDLRQLCTENNWATTLYESQRDGVDVIVDDENHIVAVQPGYEKESW